MKEKSTAARRLRQLRRERRLLQREVAEQAGINIQTVINYENGSREPSAAIMARLERFFGVSGAYIMGLTDERQLTSSTERSAEAEPSCAATALKQAIQRHDDAGLREAHIDDWKYRAELHQLERRIMEQRKHPTVTPAEQQAAAEAERKKFLDMLPGEIYSPGQLEMILEWFTESQKTELIKKLLIGDGHGVGF